MLSTICYQINKDLSNNEILKIVEKYESFRESFPQKVNSYFFEEKVPLSIKTKVSSMPSKYSKYIGNFSIEIIDNSNTRVEKFIFNHKPSGYIEYNHECSSMEFAVKVFLLLAKSIAKDKITVYRNSSSWEEEILFTYINLMNDECSFNEVKVNSEDEIEILV